MGFFSRLFSGKSKEQEELEEIFDRVLQLLNDDALQTKFINPMLQPMINHTPMDMLPNGIGEFGRDPRNPIPCNGPLGEITYLSRLALKNRSTNENIHFTFHRVASQKVGEIGVTVDKYEMLDYNGVFYDVLYLDMYHATKSSLCPMGYNLEPRCEGFRGINSKNEDFPNNQYYAVMDCAKASIGVPAIDVNLKNMNYEAGSQTMFLMRMGLKDLKWWDPESFRHR